MERIFKQALKRGEAGLWSLGQAGYVIKAAGRTVAIDPYLSDSVGKVAPDFARALPVPIRPEELKVDIFIVTHDHLDHLDPETIAAYRHKGETAFVAPRLAAAKLAQLGVQERNIRRIGVGETADVEGVKVTGIFAVPTSEDVADTTGYRLEFGNGRSVYHSSDTGWSEELVSKAPRAEVLLVCINGKWGNLDVGQAVRLAAAVRPQTAIPNHYDMMAKNSEDPGKFVAMMAKGCPGVKVKVLGMMEGLVW
jgi:L-ascorbate 6-phosphate lactonase